MLESSRGDRCMYGDAHRRLAEVGHFFRRHEALWVVKNQSSGLEAKNKTSDSSSPAHQALGCESLFVVDY